MAHVEGGPVTWSADRDDEGYRTYKVTYLVSATITESPAAVMRASGLPATGSSFQISGYSGTDSWVWCRPEMSVRIHQEKEGDPATYYLVEKTFSNKTEKGKSLRCQDTEIDDPLLEPMKISGNFGRTQWEAKYNMYGAKLVTSANEPITGPGVTFDYIRPTVRIEQNVANLGLATFANMTNTVNAYSLWGCSARCIKLASTSWERKVFGKCGFYFTRSFEFEIDYYNVDKDFNIIGFDKEVLDSGSKCLRGNWITDATDTYYGSFWIQGNTSYTDSNTVLNINESDFMAFKDLNSENSRVVLDGHGRPANAKIIVGSTKSGRVPLTGTGFDNPPYTTAAGVSGPPASAVCKYYRESDFLLLGIPTSLS